MKLQELKNLNGLVQSEVIAMYANLITESNMPNEEIARINQMILDKWSNSGLIFIKDRAWRIVKGLKKGQHFKL